MIAPADEPTQPNKLMLPNAAILAGSKKMPEAMVFPMTNEVHVNNPILAGLLAEVIGSKHMIEQKDTIICLLIGGSNNKMYYIQELRYSE